MRKTIHCDRRFLGRPEANSLGAIKAVIHGPGSYVSEMRGGELFLREFDADLTLSDGSGGSFFLDLESRNDAEYGDNLHQVEVMIDVLREFRDAYAAEYAKWCAARQEVYGAASAEKV